MARRMIALHEPCLTPGALRHLRACLASGWVSTAGPYVARFEEATRRFTRTRHAVSTSTGTAALHAALLALGIGPGDEVVVPDLTFVATANAVAYTGASPVLAPVSLATACLDAAALAPLLGPKTRAIIPVHLFGIPVDMDALRHAIGKRKIAIIEDATESLGATWRGQQTGGLGEFGVLSFNGNKTITAGGGGMVLARRQRDADRVRHLSTQARTDALEFYHDAVGYNYRLTAIQAALGVSQMEALPRFLRRKRAIAKQYRKELSGLPGVRFPEIPPEAEPNYWLNWIRILPPEFGRDSRSLIRFLAGRGIQARPLFCPLHRLAPYRRARRGPTGAADRLFREGVCLPSSPALSREEQARVIASLRAACRSRAARAGG